MALADVLGLDALEFWLLGGLAAVIVAALARTVLQRRFLRGPSRNSEPLLVFPEDAMRRPVTPAPMHEPAWPSAESEGEPTGGPPDLPGVEEETGLAGPVGAATTSEDGPGSDVDSIRSLLDDPEGNVAADLSSEAGAAPTEDAIAAGGGAEAAPTSRPTPPRPVPIRPAPLQTWARRETGVRPIERAPWTPPGPRPEAPPVDEASETIRIPTADDGTVQLLPGRLVMTQGPDIGKEFRFLRMAGQPVPQVTLGRISGAPYKHIQLAAATVSRMHARMRFEDGAWHIANLSTTNPVRINGRELAPSEESRLENGDRIQLGEVEMSYIDGRS